MIIKKIAALSAAIMLILSTKAYASSLYTVYDLSEETRLSTGITYEKIEKYTSSGWMNINVIRANLTDKYTHVDPIKSEKGVSNRTPLSSMIKSSGAVAGVNGDFFYMGDPTYTYGALIANGNLITSPLPLSDGYPTVSRLLDGTVDISVWNPKITLYGSDSTAFNVVVINKTSSLDWGPTILTTDWNKMSPGYTNKDILEIVVVNNTVTDIRKNQPSTTIPEKGFVIASSNATTMNQMVNSFKQGQYVSLNIELDYSAENVEWAFGGLNYLVKNGELNDVSSQVLGKNPRTAIGFNKDNSEMIMVTIDGRNKDYVGVKQTELSQIMIELGAYNAVNMDGGGSTTMGVDFLKNSTITVVNIPSDGKERKIASGVGVFNTSPESTTAKTVEIIPASNYVFNNTEVGFELKLYNEFYTPLSVMDKDINFTVTPSSAGKVINNIFYPSKAGKAIITANVDNAKNSVEIEILEKPVSLDFNLNSLIMGYGDTYELGNILGIDKYGNSAYIPSKYMSFSYRNRVGKVDNGIFTAGDTSNTGAITATFGDAIKHIQVKVGYRYKTLNRFETLDNLKLNLYPEVSTGKFSISKDFVKEGSNSLKLEYDFTKMTDQSIAFIELGEGGNGIKLEDKPISIGMWVYGDGKNHWLRTRITDAYNNQIKLTFEDEVNWTGWKWVEADIPEGTSYPITLNNIYLAEINETRKNSGTIYIDNLRIMYEPKDKELGLKAETEFVDSLKTIKVSDYIDKLLISSGKGEFVSSSTYNENNRKIIYFEGVISEGTLSPSNITMWENIKSFTSFNDKVLVLSLNGDLNHITDQREVKVLKEILEKAAVSNQVFVVFKGDEENTVIENSVRYITYDDNFEIGTTNNSTAYKN